jgi:hypothetical protein
VDLQQAYCDLHEVLRTDADLQSAKAVLELAGRKSQDIAPQ